MFNKIYFKTLPSTNLYLKENYKFLPDGTVVICNNQTAGRGRFGRVWEMEEGSNIAISILLKPEINIERISRLSLLTSAAMYNTLSKYSNNVTIKWPNDILINNKKVCGILLESIISKSIDALIIGIGVNLNADNVPDYLKNKATSLYLETKKFHDKDKVINEILNSFKKLYNSYLKGNELYLNICKEHSSIIGKEVRINGEQVIVCDIKDNGNILVTNGLKEIEYAYGEVTIDYDYQRTT